MRKERNTPRDNEERQVPQRSAQEDLGEFRGGPNLAVCKQRQKRGKHHDGGNHSLKSDTRVPCIEQAGKTAKEQTLS